MWTCAAHAKANTGAQVACGVNGFKVFGMVLGVAVHSRALGYTMARTALECRCIGLLRSRTRSGVPEEYGGRDWDREAVGRNCWHGVQDLGSSSRGKKLKSSRDRLLVRPIAKSPLDLTPRSGAQ
jgi:hypothetical protein